jgi:hypothetical protein
MPQFTFEIARDEGPPVAAYELSLTDYRAAWCHAEFLACKYKDSSDSYILVKDENGGVTIRTGIATALASIQTCRRANCPVKRLSE